MSGNRSRIGKTARLTIKKIKDGVNDTCTGEISTWETEGLTNTHKVCKEGQRVEGYGSSTLSLDNVVFYNEKDKEFYEKPVPYELQARGYHNRSDHWGSESYMCTIEGKTDAAEWKKVYGTSTWICTAKDP